MGKVRGALVQALSLTLVSAGAANATRLYPEHSPAPVGALITVLGAVFYSLASRLPFGRAATPAAKVRWGRPQWRWGLILIVPSAFQGQVHQAALERVEIGTFVAILTLGLLGLSTWRLVSSAHGADRGRNALWFVIGLVGVTMLTRPFAGEAEVWGLVLAGLAAVMGVNGTVATGRLTELGTYWRVVEINCWSGVFLVGVPVLIWTDDHWMTWPVLSTVAVTSLLNTASNMLGIRAWKLARSDDGLISTVKCLNPVLACLVGVIVGTGGPPGLYGWIGAVVLVGASLAALRAFHRQSEHVGPQAAGEGGWKPRLPVPALNGEARSGIPPSGFRLSTWKPDDSVRWKYDMA
ncbi:hypothetical protein ACQEU6_41940 [Spirillospora sp. CA-108201]